MSATRLVPSKVSPAIYKAVGEVDALLRQSDLDPRLMELIKIRASQMNGCGFCLKTHSQTARRAEEDQKRLDVLAGWREVDLFTPQEKAALAWTESLTDIAETRARDEDYDDLASHFSEKEIVDLTILIGLINLFNRLAISMRYEVS